MKLQKDLREFTELLNSAGIKYLLVGGYAVAYHGFPRFTGDMDFFVESSPSNLSRLAGALNDFGLGSLAAQMLEPASPGTIFQLGRPPHRVDLLTSIDDVGFEEAWQSREVWAVDGLEIFVLSKSLLLRNKSASGRPQDIEDVRQLKKI